MTARLGDDEYQGYGSIDEAAGGEFNPRASEGRFGELQSRLSKAIFDIGRQTNTLREYHRQISRGQQGDIATLAIQMENKLADVQKMCKDAGQNMFNLVLSAKNSGEREKQLVANTLRADFERAFGNFKSVQTDVIHLLKNLPSQQPPDFGVAPTYGDSGEIFIEDDNEHARLIRKEQESRHRREIEQRRQQQLLLEDDTTMIQQRAEEMRQLEADVLVLNDLMRDIMELVIEQGEQIDTIEQHVEYTQQKTVAGRKKLQQAKALQQSNRRLCCCIICIIVIVVVILAIVGAVIGGTVKH